jgi:hypothetical protein
VSTQKAYRKEAKDQEFFSGGEGVTIKGNNDSVHKGLHLLLFHEVDQVGQILALGLEQIKQVGVVLDGNELR